MHILEILTQFEMNECKARRFLETARGKVQFPIYKGLHLMCVITYFLDVALTHFAFCQNLSL